eukprot:COSAG06_NODE_32987_length_497_cov_0.693467_1_plen_81_part_01
MDAEIKYVAFSIRGTIFCCCPLLDGPRMAEWPRSRESQVRARPLSFAGVGAGSSSRVAASLLLAALLCAAAVANEEAVFTA